MRPIFYYNDRFRLGTLSGSNVMVVNPVERVADGFVGLSYTMTSGTLPTASGSVQVTLAVDDVPHSLVIAKATTLSGYRIILESEDVGGGGNAVRVDEAVTSAATSVVYAISGDAGSARRVWRLTLSGDTAGGQAHIYEAMLADRQLMPRSNEVGVERSRVRQYTRMVVPGGQPFVVRDGPRIRSTRYSFTVLSGSEVAGLEAFVDGIEGGEAFFHVDDRGEQYMAELPNPSQVFSDAAGVLSIDMLVREVAVN
jgi:hypothetical protein